MCLQTTQDGENWILSIFFMSAYKRNRILQNGCQYHYPKKACFFFTIAVYG